MSKDYSKYSTFLTFFSLIGFSTILKRAGIYKKDGPEKRGLNPYNARSPDNASPLPCCFFE